MKKLLYFAYGSNLLTARLHHRIGNAEYLKNYRLMGYKLVFDCQGYANIQPSPNDYVDGALYCVTSEQISDLNRFEALYNAEFFDYNKDTLIVVYVGKEEAVYMSQTYKVQPQREYLEICMRGMLSKGLKQAHDYTEAIYNSLPVRKPEIFKRKVKRKKRK